MRQHFLEKGWAVLDLVDVVSVRRARERLEQELERVLGKRVALEEYHKAVVEDAEHTEVQGKLTQVFREEKLGGAVIAGQRELFQQIVGLDLWVQANPYLRMTRPGKPQDNIGYHRDTFYGGSPYEISVLVPYVNLEGKESLGVISGSHVLSEKLFPTVQVEKEEVVKGSMKHKLGFLYAPKLMSPEIERQIEQVPLKMGQALIFSLSTVHGSVVNQGNVTRWSSDIRVVNALAPLDLSARPDYYEPLCTSVVTTCAKQYEEANRG